MGPSKTKPKVGVFSFTSCEGCQLQILNLEKEFLDMLKCVDIVNFREAMSEKGQDYEVAFVEGSITREEEVTQVKKIRSQAKVLIAIGACAHLGGVNSLKMLHPKETWVKSVYGRDDLFKDTIDTRRVSDVVEVDHTIPGCPIDKGEFLRVLSSLLLGAKPVLPDHPVCVECRSKGNPCIIEEGGWCLGPVTRAGCDAICPTYGESCAGCRGVLPEGSVEELTEILMENGYTRDEVAGKFQLYNLLQDIKP